MTTSALTVTDPSAADAAEAPVAFDADRRWRLHERVALRPEPFGALAYHYGNRRLTFLRSPDLVALVEQLSTQPSARAAFDAAGIEGRRWPSFEKALTSLAAGDFIVPDDPENPEGSP
jgi:putative mycofactocin binding protein MftB